MSKKILGAAVTLTFFMSLIVTSNIQETDRGGAAAGLTGIMAGREAEGNTAVAAGVFRVFSEHSFTTESDEKTSIEKNDVIWVASPGTPNDSSMLIRNETESEILTNDIDKQDSLKEDKQRKEAAVPVPAETEAMEDAELETTEASEHAETAAQEGNGQKTDASVPKNRWNIALTEDEIDLLARIVWLEANGEPVEGQEAVVEVVFNRMTSDLYPDTLYDVLSQRNPVQFCSWKNRGIAKPTQKEYDSIHSVLNGNTSILRNDTMYFSTFPLTSNLDVKICCHSFCY